MGGAALRSPTPGFPTLPRDHVLPFPGAAVSQVEPYLPAHLTAFAQGVYFCFWAWGKDGVFWGVV